MTKDDKPLTVVRLRVEFETNGDRVACMVGDMDAESEALTDVLSMPAVQARDEEVFERFRSLAAFIASHKGRALSEAAGAVNIATGMVSDETGMLARAAMDVVADVPALAGEFEVAVGEADGRACAYLVNFHGQRVPPGASPPLVSVPVDFMGDDGVQEKFRALIEAIGICIARADMEDMRDAADDTPAAPRTH